MKIVLNVKTGEKDPAYDERQVRMVLASLITELRGPRAGMYMGPVDAVAEAHEPGPVGAMRRLA